jgi:predicted nucleotidyltransferase
LGDRRSGTPEEIRQARREPFGWFVSVNALSYVKTMDVDASRSASDAVHLGAAERAALSEFTSWVRERFGDRVSELCLFGSRARGEGHEESDLDVLVCVAELTGSERREIGQQSGDALTHWDVLLSPFALSTDHLAQLRASERRIAHELDRDAIPL